MANQAKNAANEGDILKHPLICEVLFQCREWDSITYAESHSGAGVYSSEHQKSDGPIAKLKKKHEDASRLSLPTDHYYLLLKDYWTSFDKPSGTVIKYPGSAVLAGLALKKLKEERPDMSITLRLTEAKSEPCATLRASLTRLFPNNLYDFNFQGTSSIQQDGFQNRIPWLTDDNNLVLIIDPFKLSFGPDQINEGGIDLFHLLKLIEPCKTKTAIVGFWYSADARSESRTLPYYFEKTILANYLDRKGRNIRRFTFGNYALVWMGFGDATGIVESLPTEAALKRKWVNVALRESWGIKPTPNQSSAERASESSGSSPSQRHATESRAARG